MIYKKKSYFLIIIFLIFNAYHVATFEKKITIQNIFKSNNITANTALLSGNIFFTPSLFTIGNDIQETNVYIFGLQNNNIDYYLVLNEEDQVGIFSQAVKKGLYDTDTYDNIKTNIINSNNENYTLKINSYTKNTQVGTVQSNNINIIGKTILITGSIGSNSSPYVTIKSKIILNSDLSINGSLILKGDKVIIQDGLTLYSLIAKNISFLVDNLDFSSASSFQNITIVPTEDVMMKSLILKNCPVFSDGFPSIFFGVNELQKILPMSTVPVMSAQEIVNRDKNLNIIVNNTFFIKNNLAIGKNITFKLVNGTMNGAGEITFAKEVTFNGNSNSSISVNNIIVNSLIQVDTLMLDNGSDPFILNPDVTVSEVMIFKNVLPNAAGTKLVVNTDQRYGYGRLMKPGGSSKDYKENIENFIFPKELFLDIVEPCVFKEDGKKIFFINPDKLERTFLENIVQKTEHEIVFNNKELLAIFLTQVFNIYDEITLLERDFSALDAN
jgi:hypothetical protein